MADATFYQGNFTGGEWSQFAQGRADDPVYKTALNACFNFFPTETGALVRRPGSRFLGATHNGANARLTPFPFRSNAPYNMEFSNGSLRFFSGTQLVLTNDSTTIHDISTTSPAVVGTITNIVALGWLTNQQIIFQNMGTVCPLLQNRQFTITVIDNFHFSIVDALTGLPIDGSTLNWPAAPPSPPVIRRILQIATVYNDPLWQQVRSVQAETTAVLLHPTVKPYYLSVATQPTSTAFATLTGPAAINLLDGPYLDPITDSFLSVSGTVGTITIQALGSLDNINAGQGFISTDVGRAIRLHNEPNFWDASVTYVDGQIVTYGGVYYTAYHQIGITNPNLNFPPNSFPNLWNVTPQQHIWQWGQITAVTSAAIATVSLTGGGLLFNNQIRSWRLGVYSDTTGWPSCGTYSDGRLWLAGATSNRVDASKSNDIFNFAPTDNLGQVADNNAIAAVFNAPDISSIFWMIPDQQGIIAGTQAGEWLISANATPTSISAHRVTKIGCANIEPRRTEHTTVFVQRYQRKLMEYFADVYSGKFSAPNLSKWAKHLTAFPIEEIAYQQELTPIIWARTSAGGLIGATYKRDTLTTSQGPTFIGWHRHNLNAPGTLRNINSICVGPSESGALDTLALVMLDQATGISGVEILTDQMEESGALSSAWFLDAAVIPSSYVNESKSGVQGLTLNGLWHLNGKTATVFAGGLDCGDYVVANGSCFVPFGDGVSGGTANGLFTAEYMTEFPAGIQIVVGLNYFSEGQILRPISPPDTGARTGPALGKTRRVHIMSALLENTVGISFGTSFSDLRPAIFKQDNETPYLINEPFTGVYRTTLEDSYSYDGMICWATSRPYPANVLAVTGFIQTQDS